MGKLCENQQKICVAYRVANLLGVYEDCSPNGFYQRWKQKNAFMKEQAEEFGIGSTDNFIDVVEQIVDQRRAETEWKNAEAWKNGTTAFGVRYLTPAMHLDYELKSIQLAFVTYKGEMVGNYKCHVYTEDEKRAFYDANQDLFTRYHGDLFPYEEVDLIIEKWLKVQEYQDIIESVVANTHLSEMIVNEISAQDMSDEKSDNAVQWMSEFERRISIPPLQVRRALSGGEEGCLCQWELEAPTDRSQSDCVHEQVAKADCECPLYAVWNQMQEDQRQREDKSRPEEAENESSIGNIGRCYYVSSIHGDDTNEGTEDQPLKSLYAVNRLKLKPGDQVLLERDSVFEGQFLHLNVQGTKEHPIYIGAYGTGEKPLIQTDGQGIWYQDYGNELDAPTHVYRGYVSSAVLLYDCEYLTVENLEISNKGGVFGETYSAPHKMNRTGVAGIAKNRGTLHEIHLNNLYIHDIEGNVYDKHMNNGGIYFTCLKPDKEEKTGVARYENVSVRGCHLKRISRWGIAVGYSYKCKEFMRAELSDELFEKYGHHNIYIADNYVEEIGGDGITVMYTMKPLVEYNSGDSCALEMNDRYYSEPGNRGGKVAAGIWPWKCKDALLTYNEMRDMRLNQDSMAWDADSGDGTLYQYNYSRLNEGGCVMFCLEEAIHNEFRYNVSVDDLGGTISPSGNPDAWIHHNVFYHRAEVPFVRARMDDGKYNAEDNEFYLVK